MREILFRGKREDDSKWIYGMPCAIEQSGIYAIQNMQGDIFDIIPETVGQYTGLTDKNGTKIFEGDIIRLWRSIGSNGDLRGEYLKPLAVTYGDLWCQFVVTNKEQKEQYGIWQSFQCYEVIGNIHDNPELLGGIEE